MTVEATPVPIRRILVALDSTPSSEEVLEGAARLAASLEAELLGLFIEDINLLNLAGLPFARESSLSFALTRRLVAKDMERSLRARAGRAREQLEKTATRRSLRWSFRVVRGRMTEVLQSATEQADLVAFGLPARARSGAGTTAMARTTDRTVLFLPPGATLRPPFGVVVDRHDGSRRALELAAQLAAADDRQGVTVLVSPCDDREALAIEGQVTSALRARQAAVERLYRLEVPAMRELLSMLDAARLGTLILPADLDWLTQDALGELLGAMDVAVLLVR